MSPGTNAGTGQPIAFRCSVCRVRHGLYGIAPNSSSGLRDRVELTGRRRPAPQGNARGRNSQFCLEYVCKDCGHTGWSRHIDLEHKAKALGQWRALCESKTRNQG